MDIEEDIKALQLESSEDSVMTNAEDGKPDEALKPGKIDGDDSVMSEECKPDDVEKPDNMEDGLKEEANANLKPTQVDDEIEVERKRHLNVVFGHVDAGKSTCGGQILFLSGQVDDRTIQKYEKEAKDTSRGSW